MVKGIVTYIANNRNKTASKIRLGSRKWVLARYINLNENSLLNIIGSQMVFNGRWQKTPSYGKVFLAADFNLGNPIDIDKAFKRVKKFAYKNVVKISDTKLETLKSLVVPLFLIGKKALLAKFLNWTYDKQITYNANPYLFYLNNHLDYYSAEVLSFYKKFPVSDDKRMQALIRKTLEDLYKDGCESIDITSFRNRLVEKHSEDIEHLRFVELVQSTPKVSVESDSVCLSWIFYLRKMALSRLNVQEIHHVDLSTHDDNIQEILKHKWSILTGPAGSGKTTLLRKLKNINGLNVVYSAMTGHAATLLPDASTVHRLFGFSKGKFTIQRLENCDLLVVDESSMLTWHELYAIVRAVPRAIFAGSPNQLPPVHGESVFKKMMEVLPTVKLVKKWRFASSSESDMIEVINKPDDKSIFNSVVSIASILNIKNVNFQILSPVKVSLLGIDCLNKSLQKSLNSNHNHFLGPNRLFLVNDKIIVKRNVYIDGELIASNGDVGTAKYDRDIYIAVKLNNNRIVLLEEKDIDLAYALTIHRAQGSEYDYVILVIPSHVNSDFLTSELIHVGRTRGKIKTYILAHISVTSKLSEELAISSS